MSELSVCPHCREWIANRDLKYAEQCPRCATSFRGYRSKLHLYFSTIVAVPILALVFWKARANFPGAVLFAAALVGYALSARLADVVLMRTALQRRTIDKFAIIVGIPGGLVITGLTDVILILAGYSK